MSVGAGTACSTITESVQCDTVIRQRASGNRRTGSASDRHHAGDKACEKSVIIDKCSIKEYCRGVHVKKNNKGIWRKET